MNKHEKFSIGSLAELKEKITETGAEIKVSEDFAPLRKPTPIGNKLSPNAMAILPMEGCDCTPEGGPTELFSRRYLRFAAGGAGKHRDARNDFGCGEGAAARSQSDGDVLLLRRDESDTDWFRHVLPAQHGVTASRRGA